jgi:membrane carboxypeptidase/penicillin-binding protein PbpC
VSENFDPRKDGVTPDNHPKRRVQDQSLWGKVKWWWSPLGGRGYRDVWLFGITGLALVAILVGRNQNSARIDDINVTRAQNLSAACQKSNENTRAINNLVNGLQLIIITGAVLPGDEPVPAKATPREWKTIVPGPLSKQIESLAPDFPDPQQRLEQAQATADDLENLKGSTRNCAAEVQKIQDGG